ncbi:DUF6543 domain-containing protein [Pseudomonas sp. SWRI154]|uniref:dermonecrotic toxin domain-containing protein n=1 Tax=Pseudomonas sp. SWRI154 TaxID=2745501 RepID=UPI00164497A5|nr:DUF6543 domain-containing protein [Pseudomonas sp. SWRI154]MBC3365521.1 hypothetical protein [Pseudomonas sp. SWRI154]
MTSASPTDRPSALAERVSQQFAGRPTFEQVAQTMLELTLKEKYPTLDIDLSKTQLATPDATGKAWIARPFMPLVLDYLALGTPVDFSSHGALDAFLSDAFPRRLRLDTGASLDISVVEKLVLELPWTVPIGLEHALTRYWNANIDPASPAATKSSISRWRWLGDTLRNMLQTHALQQSGLTQPARVALDQIVRWPDRDQRFSHNVPPVYAYSLESTLVQGIRSTVLPSPDLLLLHYTPYGLVILLCSPGATVKAFDSMEAFNNHWRERIASRYVVDSVTLQRYEIGGNAFDAQAGSMLEQQLADLKTVRLPSSIGQQMLGALYSELTDPARDLRDAPRLLPETSEQLAPLLPEWLKKAPVVEQTKFQHYTLALAGARRRSEGQTYLSDIQDIKRFTADALLDKMGKTNDNSPAKSPSNHYQPDDVVLTFTVSAGYPGTVGISEQRRMSLTELAINNLVARPSANVKLSHRQGLALPMWLTVDFITRNGGLIEQVDIGTTYPRYLQQKLFDDLPQAQRRQDFFAEQIPAQLVLEALKQVLNDENGMTRQGLSLLEAVLQVDAQSQPLGGPRVVIRHLAFLRKSQAKPDIVDNMFIIEAEDVRTGPHLLYRPFYSPSLQQFPTRAAMLQAIVKPGGLQDSLLTWMSDAARPVYANGGFLEPHIVRFFQGDEFSAPEKPAPAAIAVDEASDELRQFRHNGKLMQYLYGSNGRALVAQADRESVSNRESRWAALLEGGNLLFNTLLVPLLRGPAMAVAWLWNLMASANHDIPALSSNDPMTRELATVDLLLNLTMLVSQFPSIAAPSRAAVPQVLRTQAVDSPAPRAFPEQWPAPVQPDINEGYVTLPGYANTDDAALDFSFANARNRLTPEQLTRLQRMQVPRPSSLPEPIKNGPLMGLYVIGNKWHALVENTLYQASVETDASVTIVDPLDQSKKGPMLRSDGAGNWSIDLGLRLRAGMPGNRVMEQRRLNAQRKTQLIEELREFSAQQARRQQAVDTAQTVMQRVNEASTYTDEQRAAKRKVFYELLEEQVDLCQKILDNEADYTRLNIEPPSGTYHALMQNVVNDARKAYVVVEMDLQDLLGAHPQFMTKGFELVESAVVDVQRYERYLTKLADINDRSIHWLELKDRYLEKLLNLGAAGEQAFKRLTEGRSPNERNALATKALQLPTLASQVFSPTDRGRSTSLTNIIEPLIRQVRSHSDMRLYDLTASEHLEVLETLTEQYGKALDGLHGLKALDSSDLRENYFDRLLKLVESLYQDVSKSLVAEIKPEPKPRKRPPKRPKISSGRPQKKVIKTRKSGVLIGDLKPADENMPIDVVELRSEIDDHVLATYSQHEEVWDVVEERRPVPAPRTRALRRIKSDARALLDQLPERLRNADAYKKYCKYPQELEERMGNEADRYRELSHELDRAFSASQTPATAAEQALSKQLSDAVTSLTTKGRALRTELSLKLPPTDGNLQHLFKENLIQVARLGGRIALKGARKDFLQEYAINDRNGFPLWYAHFHYETAETPKADYGVAHLKTKEQRKEHYHSLLAKADNPYAILEVHRGLIGKSLAKDKFLPLAD